MTTPAVLIKRIRVRKHIIFFFKFWLFKYIDLILILTAGCVGSVSVHKAMRPYSSGREPCVPAC